MKCDKTVGFLKYSHIYLFENFFPSHFFHYVTAVLPYKSKHLNFVTLRQLLINDQTWRLSCVQESEISLPYINFDDPFAIAVYKRTTTRLGLGNAIHVMVGYIHT